jgi:hypothetical protein
VFNGKALKKIAMQQFFSLSSYGGNCVARVLFRVYTNPKNGRVKALSKACLDRTYFGSPIIVEPKPRYVKALSAVRLYHQDLYPTS